MSLFLNKFSVIAGGSCSGKTTLVNNVINKLKQDVPKFTVITPGYNAKNSPIFPTTESFTESDMNSLFETQDMEATLKKAFNDVKILSTVYNAIAPQQFKEFVEVNKFLTTEEVVLILRRRLGSGDLEKQKKIKTILESGLLTFGEYNPTFLMKAYGYIDKNINHCLVIDEMTAELQKFSNYKLECGKNAFLEMIVRGKYIGLTVIIITHVFRQIEKKARSSIPFMVFTDYDSFKCNITEVTDKKHSVTGRNFVGFKAVYDKLDWNESIKFVKLDDIH